MNKQENEHRKRVVELLNNCIVGESVSNTADQILLVAESLAKERAVEFYLEALSEEEQRDESVIELVKSKYDTFLAEKRKEGAE